MIKSLLEDGIDVEKEMANPEYKMAIEERKKLKSKLGKVKSKIGEYYLNGNATVSSTKKSVRLKEEIEGIEKEIANANERIKYLPEKIKRFDYVKANQIFQLGNEKKEYFDLLKFISYNVRRDIAEIVGNIYKNNRDIHTIIVKWLKSKCVIQKLNGQMIVTLPCPGKKNESRALKAYCEYLSSLNYRHFNTGEIMQFNLAQSM